jgi:hypothetical protein
VHYLPHPEKPQHVGGTSAHTIIHALGNNGRLPEQVTQLAPRYVRDLRHVAHNARRNKSRVHVFGVLDNASPYGSRHAIEEAVRWLSALNIPVSIHAGIWHSTPNDLSRGIKEIESLRVLPTQPALASLFSLQAIATPLEAQKYIDGIFHPSKMHSRDSITLPLHQPLYLIETTPAAEDVYFIATHNQHGFDTLVDALSQHANQSPTSFTS